MVITAIALGSKSVAALHFLLLFVMEWLYPVFFEVFSMGQTPGKRALGIKVIRDDGAPLDVMSSLIRDFLRVVDIFPFFYGVGLLSCLLDHRFRRLGDLAAKTLVIYNDKPLSLPIGLNQSPLPLPLLLNPQERAAMLSYLERRHSLSQDRQIELAETLIHLHGQKGERAKDIVSAYGAHLRGES
jgi:hypothetical protein